MSATIKGGTYAIFPPYVYHAFVGAETGSQTTWFDCYLGHDGTDRTYPVVTALGNIDLIRTIACFDPTDIRTEYNHHIGGPLMLGDCTGLVYGIFGICHQMANRLLYTTNIPVMFPPYWIFTFLIWGVYGRPVNLNILPSKIKTAFQQILIIIGETGDTVNWQQYLKACRIKLSISVSFRINLYSKVKLVKEFQKIELSGKPYSQVDHLKALLKLNKKHIKGLENKIISAFSKLIKIIEDLDTQVLGKKIKPLDFINDVNNSFQDFIKTLTSIMGSEKIQDVFDYDVEKKFHLLEPIAVKYIEGIFK